MGRAASMGGPSGRQGKGSGVMSIWPQITWFTLTAAGIALAFQKDKGVADCIGTCVSILLNAGLLYAGGFFDPILR